MDTNVRKERRLNTALWRFLVEHPLRFAIDYLAAAQQLLHQFEVPVLHSESLQTLKDVAVPDIVELYVLVHLIFVVRGRVMTLLAPIGLLDSKFTVSG